ncbi:MAG: hypothetical protein A2452_06640 [Candidatus Firestonebacteria bacterium RIFOXYC2_FULL_39_67]|nr:MAG: hypothetical protein A2452_06640 [Candidatus Firestonebacteria bacterium RIFOXYC2_FULL_39_67]
MEKNNNLSAVILCGGKALRMGGVNKAFIEVEGASILNRTINIFKDIFKEVILVTNTPEQYKEYKNDAVIITDIIKGVGPLGGIYAALINTSKQGVFVVACDMPFIDKELIIKEIDCFNSLETNVLVPRVLDRIEPLHAVYSKCLSPSIKEFISSGKSYAIKIYLKTVKVDYFDLENNDLNRKVFLNLNSTEDFAGLK